MNVDVLVSPIVVFIASVSDTHPTGETSEQ